jgi:glycine/D-amino acid oxidase-like deaminating enzyme
VSVYRSRAAVTRAADCTLAQGVHELRVGPLPEFVDLESVQARIGAGGKLLDLKTESVALPAPSSDNPRVREALGAVEKARAALVEVDRRIANNAASTKLIDSIAAKTAADASQAIGSTLDPEQLVKALHARTLVDGASMVMGDVTGFERRAGTVKALTLADGTRVECDGVVVAGGAWSAGLTRQLGLSIPLETQRGYHVTVQSSNLALKHTVMAVEYNLMVNPMAMGLRLAGSVEFAGLKPPPNYARADVLLAKGRELFPHLDVSRTSRWMGHRPCLPDSLPVIGLAPESDNVWLAFGHGHVGMCAGASTGREVAHLVAGRAPQIDLTPFRPDRF